MFCPVCGAFSQSSSEAYSHIVECVGVRIRRPAQTDNVEPLPSPSSMAPAMRTPASITHQGGPATGAASSTEPLPPAGRSPAFPGRRGGSVSGTTPGATAAAPAPGEPGPLARPTASAAGKASDARAAAPASRVPGARSSRLDFPQDSEFSDLPSFLVAEAQGVDRLRLDDANIFRAPCPVCKATGFTNRRLFNEHVEKHSLDMSARGALGAAGPVTHVPYGSTSPHTPVEFSQEALEEARELPPETLRDILGSSSSTTCPQCRRSHRSVAHAVVCSQRHNLPPSAGSTGPGAGAMRAGARATGADAVAMGAGGTHAGFGTRPTRETPRQTVYDSKKPSGAGLRPVGRGGASAPTRVTEEPSVDYSEITELADDPPDAPCLIVEFADEGPITKKSVRITKSETLFVGRKRHKSAVTSTHPGAVYHFPASPEYQRVMSSKHAHIAFGHRTERCMTGFAMYVIQNEDKRPITNPLWYFEKKAWAKVNTDGSLIWLSPGQHYSIAGKFGFEIKECPPAQQVALGAGEDDMDTLAAGAGAGGGTVPGDFRNKSS